MISDHHWVDGATLKPNPGDFFGFLYEIHELDTGRKYVGIKQYWFSSGKAKRRCMDKQSPNWKDHHWKPSDWRTYTGSSKKLNKAIKEKGKDNYEFSIIGQYPCSRSLRYAEANYLHKVDALTEKNQEGEYVYYNESIQDIKFRPPETHSEESKQKMSANHDYVAIGKKRKANRAEKCKKCGDSNWKPKKAKGYTTRRCQTCETQRQRERRARNDS